MKIHLNAVAFASILALFCVQALAAPDADRAKADGDRAQTAPTLKQITAEQDWIARSPQFPRWLVDGSAIKFSQRRPGLVGRDFSDSYLIFMSNPDAQPSKITPENPGPFFTIPFPSSADWNLDHTRQILTNAGNLFLYDTNESDSITQLTRTAARESNPLFLAPIESGITRYAYKRDGTWFIRSLDNTWEIQAADIKFADAPKEEQDDPDLNSLEQQQRDLFNIFTLEDQRDDMRFEDTKAWRDTNPTSVTGPFYMGKDKRSMGTYLSPSSNHILVVTAPKARPSDKRDIMPNYVTDDGYVSTQPVRAKVGYESQTPIELFLLDLESETIYTLSLENLPTIKEDPLAWLKEPKTDPDADTDTEESEPAEESERDPRPVSFMGIRWSDSGQTAAVMLRSHDNKDRWIAIIDTNADEPTFVPAHHLYDEAWINWDFNEFGFLPNSGTLWYLSEESGYSHFYTHDAAGTITQHTAGNFEVRDVTISHDGQAAFIRTNRTHPGIEELERLGLATNSFYPITSMGGTVESYQLSPDETQVALTYSNINQPPELFLVKLTGFGQSAPIRLTYTITDEFLDPAFLASKHPSLPPKNKDYRFSTVGHYLPEATVFQTPKIVPIPSSHTEQPIYTRIYLPDAKRFPGPRPLVLFSHGAGYLQHANYEWSYYKREHMFHTILTNEGFIVVAPDFRASSGYGRDWRTAIYRQMGYKELEDFKETIDYAVANYNADPDRVGIYGGSYGGFMTLMAMFLEPETYKAGAALRSVTDWRHYNQGYTANILNTPDIDPQAFDISSPINHAEGLQGHLLMLHGLQDNNVVAQDIIRLSQRLIELEKQNWELALAPIEPHGYHEPSSWLDQMRRIHKLFLTELAED